MANLRGLVFGLTSGWIPAFWAQIVTAILSAGVLLWVALGTPRKLRASDAMILAITTATLVSYYLFIHDLSVLLIPLVITLNRFVTAEGTRDIFGYLIAVSSALLLLAPTCVFLMPNHFYLLAFLIFAFLFLLMRSFTGDTYPKYQLEREATVKTS